MRQFAILFTLQVIILYFQRKTNTHRKSFKCKLDNDCDFGECCSEYGNCGIGFDYCPNTIGPQQNGSCVYDYDCKLGECCSKYGNCGVGFDFCRNTIGPQFKDRCANDHDCGQGQCCSKNGWCGEGHNFCKTLQGEYSTGYCFSDLDCVYGQCCNDGLCGKSANFSMSLIGPQKIEYCGLTCDHLNPCRFMNECCSPQGFCGTGPEYCGLINVFKKPVVPDDPKNNLTTPIDYRIFDCFLYNGEKELLKLRLASTYEEVFRYLIVEGGYTFTGQKKNDTFDIQEFAEYKEKIVYIKNDKLPKKNAWKNEEYSRNLCAKPFRQMSNQWYQKNDVLLIGDVDEIVNNIKLAAENYFLSNSKIGKLQEKLYWYNFNNMVVENRETATPRYWYHHSIISSQQLRDFNDNIASIRMACNNYDENVNGVRNFTNEEVTQSQTKRFENVIIQTVKHYFKKISDYLFKDKNKKFCGIIPSEGHHFTWMMSAETIVKKIQCFSHTELVNENTTNATWIQNRINNNQDIFIGENASFYRGEEEKQFVSVLIDKTFPSYMRNNSLLFKEMLNDQQKNTIGLQQNNSHFKNSSDMTAILTSCNRYDLLNLTLSSFFKYNTYALKRLIITEDCLNENAADFRFSQVIQELLDKGYIKSNDIKYIQLIVNPENLGLIQSLDKLLNLVDTEYFFQMEDDWRFTRGGFIEDSVVLLNHYKQNNQLLATIRLRDIHEIINDYHFHSMSKIKDCKGIYHMDLYSDHQHWRGFSFNPHVGQKKVYVEHFGSSYKELVYKRSKQFNKRNGAHSESQISQEYDRMNYTTVVLYKSAVSHIGDERSAHYYDNADRNYKAFEYRFELLKKTIQKFVKNKHTVYFVSNPGNYGEGLNRLGTLQMLNDMKVQYKEINLDNCISQDCVESLKKILYPQNQGNQTFSENQNNQTYSENQTNQTYSENQNNQTYSENKTNQTYLEIFRNLLEKNQKNQTYLEIFRNLFYSEYQINQTYSQNQTNQTNQTLLIFGGGGTFCDLCQNGVELVNSYSEIFNQTIVLPSTYQYKKFKQSSNITYFARSYFTSLTHNADAIFTDDLAFYNTRDNFTLGFNLYNKLPVYNHAFLFRTCPESTGAVKQNVMKNYNFDLSSKGDHLTKMDLFMQYIDEIDVIWTDRLNVAIAGLILDKYVMLYRSAEMNKIVDIYKSSFKDLDFKKKVFLFETEKQLQKNMDKLILNNKKSLMTREQLNIQYERLEIQQKNLQLKNEETCQLHEIIELRD